MIHLSAFHAPFDEVHKGINLEAIVPPGEILRLEAKTDKSFKILNIIASGDITNVSLIDIEIDGKSQFQGAKPCIPLVVFEIPHLGVVLNLNPVLAGMSLTLVLRSEVEPVTSQIKIYLGEEPPFVVKSPTIDLPSEDLPIKDSVEEKPGMCEYILGIKGTKGEEGTLIEFSAQPEFDFEPTKFLVPSMIGENYSLKDIKVNGASVLLRGPLVAELSCLAFSEKVVTKRMAFPLVRKEDTFGVVVRALSKKAPPFMMAVIGDTLSG